MIPVLSRAQMRAFDARAIGTLHVPGLLLMENAGRGAAEIVAREALGGKAKGARVVVVCGAGNNGGDGFVVARHLAAAGAYVEALLAVGADKLKGDARTNYEAWTGLGGHARDADADTVARALEGASVVVDALFGTGLDRAIEGELADVVRALNGARAPRVAIDLPSGLDADTGAELGVAVAADHTATFAHYKLGLLTPHGARLAGRVHVVGLGVPAGLDGVVDRSAELLERADVAEWIAPRGPDAHKGSAGHLVAVAGSHGKTGAALLVARAALRAGAGLATIASWSDSADTLDARVLEEMTARIDDADIPKSADDALHGKRAVVIGPGLGLEARAGALVEHVLASARVPVVVDADALSALAGRVDLAARAEGRAILTPHPGEMGRLLGTSAADVEGDRFGAARALATRAASVVVLKGAHTVVAAPDGRVLVSPFVTPALATAGAGDVLSGIVGALACTLPPLEAACAGVFVHAEAAAAWSREKGGADRGMVAHEIADRLPAVVAALAREHTRWPL